jgi:arginyl-tRNA synthetase
LNFDGETGPYVQYAVARTNSVMEKVSPETLSYVSKSDNIDYSLLCDDVSYEVIKHLEIFPERVIEAADKYEPYIISRCLISLVHAFNKFYDTHKILTDDQKLTAARVVLTQCVRDVLKIGLGLLCIAAPEKM